MWGDSRAKLDYAALACKAYSAGPKKELSSKWWKWKFKTWIKIFHVSLRWIVLGKRRICGNFVLCFYCNLSTAWPNFEQLKWKANEFGQESSHKNNFFRKKTTQSHQASADSQRIKFEIFWKYCDSIKAWC